MCIRDRVQALVGPVQIQLAIPDIRGIFHDFTGDIQTEIIAHEGAVEKGPVQHPFVVGGHPGQFPGVLPPLFIDEMYGVGFLIKEA